MSDVRSPAQLYQNALDNNQCFYDDAQAQAVQALDIVWQNLIQRVQSAPKLLKRFRRTAPVQGLYMWGGVGRGKTWLMDNFYQSVPFRRKKRMHFHHFMQDVHRQLNALSGQRDPLKQVAQHIYDQAVVLCFDEFFVSNVADAMILTELFQHLFNLGITLVATSNIAPDGLYKNGIHRDQFMPTIELLEQHCTILNVDAGIDYRLRALKQAELFKCPLGHETDEWMDTRFKSLIVEGSDIAHDPIEVSQREVQTIAYSHDVLWCEFSELCLKPRSPADFIEIANRYSTVLVSHVPHLTDQLSDAVRRLIYLVDEFYDRRVKLILSSEDSILSLYDGEKLKFEIERTRSRLLEMQSDDYLLAEHRQA